MRISILNQSPRSPSQRSQAFVSNAKFPSSTFFPSTFSTNLSPDEYSRCWSPGQHPWSERPQTPRVGLDVAASLKLNELEPPPVDQYIVPRERVPAHAQQIVKPSSFMHKTEELHLRLRAQLAHLESRPPSRWKLDGDGGSWQVA